MTNTKNPKFKVHFILPNLAHHKDTLINDFFDSGIEEQEWFKSKALERQEKNISYPHDDIYIQTIDSTIALLKETKQIATAVVVDKNLDFSFEFLANSKSFNEVNEEGRRPWLRQHLEDLFLHTTRGAMLQKSFDWKEQNKPEEAARFKELKNAFDESLENALYDAKTPTFWIDNEVPENFVLSSSTSFDM